MKHIARKKGESDLLAIHFMLLPDTTDQALVSYIDDLDHMMRREVSSVLESAEGQTAANLADVLGRRTYSDTGKSVLQILHETGKLKNMHIDDIEMTPTPVDRIPLRTVLEEINKIPSGGKDDKFNPHLHNSNLNETDEKTQIAKNLIVEAELLESDANRKREEAYRIAPSLRPSDKPVNTTLIASEELLQKAKEVIDQ